MPAYWRCYYHIVWATKGREPLITAGVEKVLFRAIEMKAQAMSSSILAINAALDHIHVLTSIPPTLAAADWVKHIKGTSSHEVNDAQPNNDRFRWQGSYSVLTVGERNLPIVMDYIARQKEHHANGTLYKALEYTGE
jgi:REP-associated tyrosine transposase